MSWDAAAGNKSLFLDGTRAAATSGITLPHDVGEALHLGRFPSGVYQSNLLFDDLAIYQRFFDTQDTASLVEAVQPVSSSTTLLTDTMLLLDTNAVDGDGAIVGVQTGLDGVFGDPQPYYDSFRWNLPPLEGQHTISVRYFDRASNRSEVSQTVTLHLPPRGDAQVYTSNEIGATLLITATDQHQPVMMQITQDEDWDTAEWEPLRSSTFRVWKPLLSLTKEEKAQRGFFVRFRDAEGTISPPLRVSVAQSRLYIPIIRW